MISSELRQRARQALEQAYGAVPAVDARNYRWNARAYQEVLYELLGVLVPSTAASQSQLLQGKRVLDVGAGRGILTLAIRFLGAETHAIEKYAFDHSTSQMFKEGNEQEILALWATHGIVPYVRDFYEMDTFIPPASFDAAVNLEVIEHLKAPKHFLDAIHRALKPGGFVITSTPNYGRMQARLRLLFGKNPKIDIEPFYTLGEQAFIGHWREYLPAELVTMHRLSGFEHVRAHTFCDPFYLLKKHVSPWSLMQAAIHLVSYLLPDARYDAVCVGQKSRAAA
jgi:2-polyprenyl-3-methyl-5-hydroxy-6-metoxy-1,4-benzoquinol methylase